MVYRKGELSKAAIDRGWPYQVALRSSATYGPTYVAARMFCDGLSFCPRGHTYREGDEWINVWCFAVEADALAFQQRFGGVMVDPSKRPKWPG